MRRCSIAAAGSCSSVRRSSTAPSSDSPVLPPLMRPQPAHAFASNVVASMRTVFPRTRPAYVPPATGHGHVNTRLAACSTVDPPSRPRQRSKVVRRRIRHVRSRNDRRPHSESGSEPATQFSSGAVDDFTLEIARVNSNRAYRPGSADSGGPADSRFVEGTRQPASNEGVKPRILPGPGSGRFEERMSVARRKVLACLPTSERLHAAPGTAWPIAMPCSVERAVSIRRVQARLLPCTAANPCS